VSAKRYRYIGKERDEETGLYHLGARYYASWLGRWTAVDPIGLGDGVNRYAYSRGNPVGLRDPSGTSPSTSHLDFSGEPLLVPGQSPGSTASGESFIATEVKKERTLSYGQYVAAVPRTSGVALEQAPGTLGAIEALGDIFHATVDAFTPRLESRPDDKIPNIIGVVQGGIELFEGTSEAADALADSQANIEIAEATGDLRAANEARKERGRSGLFFGFGVASIVGGGRQLGRSLGRPRAHIVGEGSGGDAPPTPKKLYRIITEATPEENLLSNAAKGAPPRGPEVKDPSIHTGLSMFDSLDAAAAKIHVLRDRGGRTVLGIGEFTPGPGVHVKKTLRDPSHYTVTATVEELLKSWTQPS